MGTGRGRHVDRLSALGAMLTVALLVFAHGPEREAGASAAGKPTSSDPADAAGLTPGRYRVVRLGGIIAQRKSLGLKWDIVGAGAPDAGFEIMIDGAVRGSCRGADNDHEPTCTPNKPLEIDLVAGTTIGFTVVDRDVAGDEPIGAARISGLTTTGTVGARLPMKPVGKLRAGWVELAKVAPPPAPASAASSYKTRIVGLIGGVAGALLLLFLFKGFWFDHSHYLWPRTMGNLTEAEADKLGRLAGGSAEVNEFARDPSAVPSKIVEVVKVRCPFCAALLDETDHTCHACGGKQ